MVSKDRFCLFVVLLCVIPTSALLESGMNNLFALRDTVSGGKGFLRNCFDPKTPPCSWSGITCVGHKVVSINMSFVPLHISFPLCIGSFQSLSRLTISRCGLLGELPETVGNLHYLWYIDLSYNQLTGPLPISLFKLKKLKVLVLENNLFSGQLSPAIGQLQHLTKLSMSMNSISGGLPPELGSLQKLKFLNLHRNSFSGVIPTTFGNLSRLSYLDISNNKLNGSLFPEIGKLVKLSTLRLSSNNLMGPIPMEIGQLENLERLDLRNNDFTGRIPEEIGNLKRLKELKLSKCEFMGAIPRSIGGLKSLMIADISENIFNAELPTSVGELGNLTQLFTRSARLIGSIPKELGNCKKLTHIDLSINYFSGSIPEELADLKNVLSFNVEGNKLSGHIPGWFQNWRNIQSITLTNNMFSGLVPLHPLPHLVSFSAEFNLLSGPIPAEICQSISLQSLKLGSNNLTGSIEETFKGCMNLTELNLQVNHLHGEIPGYLAELPLVALHLSHNNFTGLLPQKLWESSTILHLSLGGNRLIGTIAESVGKLSSLKILQIHNNYLEGPIPRSIGTLRNLAVLSLHGNRLSGNIPLELFNCTNLVTLDLSNNNLTGHIPRAISYLTLLNTLVLSHNMLSGAIPAEICVGFSRASHSDLEFFQHQGLLNLSFNRLTGQIPTTINNCAIVVELYLQGNLLDGNIPIELGELPNLAIMDLSFNALVGCMLPWSTPFVRLQGLNLSNNHLNGSIPVEIDRIFPKITMLDLSRNTLIGTLPRTLLCNQSLSHLDVSSNDLYGQIPFSCPDRDKGSSSTLVFFDASSNHFSGILDESISNFTELTHLDIHNNTLNGILPSAISNVSTLNYLDLSSNGFSGAIPCGICDIPGLVFANFSGNHIIGTYSLEDCASGGICGVGNINGRAAVHPSHRVLMAVTICIVVAVVILLVVLAVYLGRRLLKRRSLLALIPASKTKAPADVDPTISNKLLGKKKTYAPLSINLQTFEHSLMRVTMDDILRSTENFSRLHVIGDGGFGTVYRAALPGGRRVAVKRLHGSHNSQGEREFRAEMETIGKVKHPNLVPLLGYGACSDERVLIFEYMEHGSLETWLRRDDWANAGGEVLGWPERLKICLGSARGLAFLHHGFVPHIIHRDMKSSNILLDADFEPRVADFGLARLISACETHVSTDLAGTLGYIPPEYALEMKSTARGDVYSFGVVLLEVLTGQPSTGQEIEQGGNLVSWVQWMVAHHRESELFDSSLPVSGVFRQQMARVLAVAQDCTADDPWRRPTMLEVVEGLTATHMMETGPPVVTVSREDM